MRPKWMLLFVIMAVAGLVTTATLAQCGTPLSYKHLATAGTYFTGWTTAANCVAVAYVVGKGNPVIGLGTDNGAYISYTTGCTSPGGCWLRFGVPTATDMIVNGQTTAWDSAGACPDISTDVMTLIAWENLSGGTTSHGLSFVAATAKYVTANAAWLYSAPMSPQNGKVFQVVPAPEIRASTNNNNGTWTFTVRMTAPNTPGIFADNAAFVKQFYDTTIATPPTVVTGWDVFYQIGTGAPASEVASAWTSLGTVPLDMTAGRNYTDFTTPAITYNSAGSQIFFSCAPHFADGFKPYTGSPAAPTYVVGANSAQIGPTPAGLFVSVTASALKNKQVTANWTTNVESGVVAYDVVFSNKKNGPFQVVPGTTTAPTGNGSSYSKTFPRPRGEKLFLKVKATMTSGVDEYSNLVGVGGGAATK